MIVQSNAVLWYLGEGTSCLPADALGRSRVVQWLQFEQEWIARGVGAARFFVLTGRNVELIDSRRAHGERGLDLLEAHLAGRDFLVGGSPSIADISLFAYTHVAGDAGIDLAPRRRCAGGSRGSRRFGIHRRLHSLPRQRTSRSWPLDL